MREELGVVIGVDRSPSSRRALRWAAAEAEARKLPLTVCHAWEWPYHEWPGEVVPLELARRPAARLLDLAAAWARRHHPGVPVNTVLERGAAAALLIDLSRTADLVVVGSRGYRGLAGLLAGSVSTQVATRVACPVIVVRGQVDPALDVVVGFDGSPAAMGALRFAAHQAHLREVGLRVVVARRDRGEEAGQEDQLARADDRARDELVLLKRDHPGLEAEVELVNEPAREALTAAAEKASLLVVGPRGLAGSRGVGGVRGLLLGSISQAMIQHAPCPVAVVHRT
ncbi:universal stress protein [Nonomuraea cavernae]|uniref:Universal stress protein n=1 Tax=Nonomuraea cavernae TaxID=2045107 RepID=A0A918DHM9_9ACTN|nr:universal stress protein [Nonomuraea cavernae]MCA2185530.1 universal stress protein [Nonomuraea cavernae]GGO66748.1 universal stress protein [Nonomuraea cavernae]